MNETPFFFGQPRQELFGVLHQPVDCSRSVGVVLCHPFGEEKLWSHRVFVSFARQAADAGYPVMRLDYYGNGDSDGNFEDSSVTRCLSDIAQAVDTLKARTSVTSVALVGLRFGGLLASLCAEARHDVSSLVLWAPVVHGGRFVQEQLRINVTTQMAAFREIRLDREQLVANLTSGGTANVDGYEMSRTMYEELSTVDLSSRLLTFSGRCLVVRIERGLAAKPAADVTTLAAKYPHAQVIEVEEEPFWREIDRFYGNAPQLCARTLEWLNAQ